MEILLNRIKRYIPAKLFIALQPVYHFLLSALAVAWYRWPANKLIVIGITGTTGKTTSLYLVAKMLTANGYKVGYTSTAMFSDGNKEWLNDKKMTMAGRFFIQKMLARMVKNNCQYAIIETTSEGISQFRHRFINYDILIFTGLYPEHIEAHGSFAKYKEAKGKLFAYLQKCQTKYADDKKRIVKVDSGFKKIEANRVKKIIIANGDDDDVDYFLNFWAEEKWEYTNMNELKANITNDKIRIINYGGVETRHGMSLLGTGVEFSVDNKIKIRLKLLGEFNAANAMNAVCLGLAQNLSLAKIAKALEKVKGIPGRMEIIKTPSFISPLSRGRNSGSGGGERGGLTVIVDYAFEPGAVSKLYETISSLPHKGVIHLLGSTGGGRDVARRGQLGKIAGQKADLVIVTNEDPYDEDPQTIIDQVADGAKSAGKILEKNLFKISDRRQAIQQALASAGANDLVLITGKGSEQAICLAGGRKIKWDDRQVIREELKKLLANS